MEVGDEVIAPWGKEKLRATIIAIVKESYCKIKFHEDGYVHGPVLQSSLIKAIASTPDTTPMDTETPHQSNQGS